MEIFFKRVGAGRVRRGEFCIVVLSIAFLPFLQACAPKPLYQWGGYDQCVYAYCYSADPEKAYAILSAAVTNAESNNLRLAPGLYAEYGYLLYQRGEMALAAEYFQKEAVAFPESEILMNKLIAQVKQREARETADQPEPAPTPAHPTEPPGGAD